MSTTAGNVTVGLGIDGNLKIAAYGVAEGSAVDVGATEGGIKITYTPEFYFKKADQFLGTIGAVKTDEDVMIELTLAEFSPANLAYAFGYPTTAVSGSTFTVGGNATVTERTLYINGNAPSGGTSKITVHKAVIIGATEINMVKNDKVAMKLTFKVLQDTSQTTNQQYMSVVQSGTDTTAPTVSLTSGATVVGGASTVVQLTFVESDNAIDQGTLIYGNDDNATITITDITTILTPVLKAGTISYNSGTKVLTFTPTAVWAATGADFILMVTTGVRDTAGNHLAATYLVALTST